MCVNVKSCLTSKVKTGLEPSITRFYAQANTNTKPRVMSFQTELSRRTQTLIYPPSLVRPLEKLDTLEEWVREIFSKVPNK